MRAPFKTKMGDHELNSALPDQLGLREHVFLNSSTPSISPDYHGKRRHSRAYILAGVIAFIGVVCLVVGIVLISVSQSQKFPTKSVTFTGLNQTKSCDKNSTSTSNNGSKFANPCEFSKEAVRAGLESFLVKVQTIRDSFTPYRRTNTKDLFQPYSPAPEKIKALTDKTKSLYEDLLRMKRNIVMEGIKLREGKLLALVEHELKHYFGKPYENNYYTGAWMLGPDQRCRDEPIASIQIHLKSALYIFLTKGNKTLASAEDALNLFRKFRDGINQYKSNLQRGVKSGMVQSLDECKEGIVCMREIYRSFFTSRRPETVLTWWGVRARINSFASGFSSRDLKQWVANYGSNVSQSLFEGMVKHIGEPLVSLFEYLENDHVTHCVPSNVSSGLGTRPISFVFVNGTRTSEQASKTLDGTKRIMEGKEAYAEILSYFTSTKHAPDEVHAIGWNQLITFYRKAVDIVKKITGRENEREAVSEFRTRLKSFSLCLNKQPFPLNESNNEAFQKCRTKRGAEKFCPQRYSTMMRWIEIARGTLTLIKTKILKLFHLTGEKRSIPTCPAEPDVNFSPSLGVAVHTPSLSNCRFTARYKLPFFVDKMGSEFMEWTTAVHESVPGHHLQDASYREIFKPKTSCPSILQHKGITAYKEGWAVYTEYPLMSLDTDLFKHNPLSEYGVIRSQIWRALRLVIDTSLHYKNMSRDEALALFRHYMWDDSDVIDKEVTRYQAWPGQATSYMIGQLEIWRMRNESEAKLGRKYDIRDFHYHVLSQGEVPLWFLDTYVKTFYASGVLPEAE